MKMDNHFVDFNLTRPWRNAVGYYSINSGGKVNAPLKIDCVGVKQMS